MIQAQASNLDETWKDNQIWMSNLMSFCFPYSFLKSCWASPEQSDEFSQPVTSGFAFLFWGTIWQAFGISRFGVWIESSGFLLRRMLEVFGRFWFLKFVVLWQHLENRRDHAASTNSPGRWGLYGFFVSNLKLESFVFIAFLQLPNRYWKKSTWSSPF